MNACQFSTTMGYCYLRVLGLFGQCFFYWPFFQSTEEFKIDLFHKLNAICYFLHSKVSFCCEID